MADNPLSQYLDELLTPAASPVTNWDLLLTEAVGSHRNAEHIVYSFEFAPSTLKVGHAPVLAEKQESLNPHQRFSQLLVNLTLARQLPASRLRECILVNCGQILKRLCLTDIRLHSLSQTSQAICYD